MIIIVILGFIYICSLVACAHIMVERCIEPNPVSVFIVVCPIINSIYAIYRSSGNWKSWFENL